MEQVYILCVFLLLLEVTLGELIYSTKEQLPRGTFIGDIKASAKLEETLPPSEFKTLTFSFLHKDDPNSEFLRIKEATGEIFTNEALDREKLCDSFVLNCQISFKVSVLSDSGTTFEIIPVKIFIEDINDKYPMFPQNYLKLEIPENTKDKYEIRPAKDGDAGINSIQGYTLEPRDSPFILEEVKQPGGSTKLSIVVKDMLDRESKDNYKLRVIARDGGTPRRTGEVLLDITVLDVNDHPPIFTKKQYTVSKAENISVGTPLLRVRAKDLDLGENGQVTYSFVGKLSDMFFLNSTTGQIVLINELDYELQPEYRLTVEARDLGRPSQSSEALVIVSVLDVNDDHPKLSFNLLSKGSYAEIPEDAIPGRFVAHVSVEDGDSGLNGKVSCHLDSDTFKLQMMDSKDYKIKLNGQLDRETKEEYIVTMFCQDGGLPSLTASEQFTVRVKDVNDHSPVFVQTVYAVTMKENKMNGSFVVQVSAEDKDIGVNGQIMYELANDVGNQFSIDKNSGKITTKARLDREKKPVIVFNVVAKDLGIPRSADTATVQVTLLDVNDEAPLFEKTEYEFVRDENEPGGTTVGSVYALDFDSGLGGEVLYFILPKSDPENLFSISRTDGTITTNEPLDHEIQAKHVFTVRARDKGSPSLNTTVEVTVLVADLNDNAPVFTFPNGINNTVEVLHSLHKGGVVTKLECHDADDGRNAVISYFIEEGDPKGLFSLDVVSGSLTVRRTMKEKDVGNYALLLLAQDNGVDGLSTRRVLHVKVIQDNDTTVRLIDPNHTLNVTKTQTGQAESDDSNTMMIIVICVVVATVIISLVLIVSICLVLRKRESRRPQYNEKTEEQKIMKQKESPSISLSGKIPPPSSPNDDNKLQKKEVSFSLEEVRQDPHNLTNSTHNTSFSTFKGQQSPSVNPSPTEQMPVTVKVVGSNHSSPVSFSPVTDNHVPEPAPSPLPQKDPQWQNKRTVEVKHLLELLHKDDGHSDTSGETFTSDSGRGGSDDDAHCHRGQHYTPTDQNSPRYYATKYTPCVNNRSDGSLSRRMEGSRKPGSPHTGYTRFKSVGQPVQRLDIGGPEEEDETRCSSFRHPNYTKYKSATLPGANPSPLASPLSCGSGEGYYQNASLGSHSLERNKQHSPMFKVKAPDWEMNHVDYPPPPPYPDVINSHDFNMDEGIGDSMTYCRDDDDTTTSGSYTINQDDDINQFSAYTDVVV